ncbi:hypothetical protein [Nocardioides convexus]|uniref:hypothetical protein n=1 Tax=Nocardioides convexus TaxID=2712224 RepID=UPI0024182DD3|nr:hypothetical protein [Nocardioides convexus]
MGSHRSRHQRSRAAARRVPCPADQRADPVDRAGPRGPRGLPGHRLLGADPARRGAPGLEGQRELVRHGERRDHPLRARHDP